MEVQTFYQSLTLSIRQTIDATRRTIARNKTPEEARQLFDHMAMNSYQSTSRGKIVKETGVLDAVMALALKWSY